MRSGVGNDRAARWLVGRPVPASRRRGTVTVWTIAFVPVVVTLLVVVVETNHMYHARAEFENALESAVLAATKEWGAWHGGSGNVGTATTRGVKYALANTVNGVQVDLAPDAPVTAVAWRFGTATLNGTGYDFSTLDPDPHANLAVTLQATFEVAPLTANVFGRATSPTPVTVRVAARYDDSSSPKQPRLIRLNSW